MLCENLNKTKYTIIAALFLIITSCSSSSSNSNSGVISNPGGTGGSGGLKTVTLTWNAPTAYTDGTSLNPLTAIASYTLYYGVVSGMYTQTVIIPNPGATPVSETLNLPSGTYYFVVTATDIVGYESAYSTEISRTI